MQQEKRKSFFQRFLDRIEKTGISYRIRSRFLRY